MRVTPYFLLSFKPVEASPNTGQASVRGQRANFHRYRDAVLQEHPTAGSVFQNPVMDTCRSIKSLHDLHNLSATLISAHRSQSQSYVMIDDFQRIITRCESGFGGSVLRELKSFGHLIFDMRSLKFLSMWSKREASSLLYAQGPVQYRFRSGRVSQIEVEKAPKTKPKPIQNAATEVINKPATLQEAGLLLARL